MGKHKNKKPKKEKVPYVEKPDLAQIWLQKQLDILNNTPDPATTTKEN